VAYLYDILSQLNNMNQSLQGPNIMLVNVSEKLLAFMEKLSGGKERCLRKGTFPVYIQFLEDIEEVCFDDVQLVIKQHLASLIQEFDLISPKKQKNSNGCAFHLFLMLIHCRKATKLFLNVKRSLHQNKDEKLS